MNINLNFNFWIVFGLLGQICFFMRFFFQWIASEREKKSVIPVSFWYFSLVGSAVLAIYAVHIADPVFIIGQTCGFAIYIRNLMLIKNEREANGIVSPS